MRLEARVDKLETRAGAGTRRHVIIICEGDSTIAALDAYGRDRIRDGEPVEFVELVELTKADTLSGNVQFQ